MVFDPSRFVSKSTFDPKAFTAERPPDVTIPDDQSAVMGDALRDILLRQGIEVEQPSSAVVDFSWWRDKKPWEEDIGYMEELQRNLMPSITGLVFNLETQKAQQMLSLAYKLGVVSKGDIDKVRSEIESKVESTFPQGLAGLGGAVVPENIAESEIKKLKDVGAGMVGMVTDPLESLKQDPAGTALFYAGLALGGRGYVAKFRGAKSVKPISRVSEVIEMSNDQLRATALRSADAGFIEAMGGAEEAAAWIRRAPIDQVTYTLTAGEIGALPEVAFHQMKTFWKKNAPYTEVMSTKRGGSAHLESRLPAQWLTYDLFKDVKAGVGGGWRTTVNLLKEMDGAVPTEVKVADPVKFPKQVGPVEGNIKGFAETVMQKKIGWLGEQAEALNAIHRMVPGKKNALTATKVLGEIDTRAAYADPKVLAEGKIGKITQNLDIIKAAQTGRRFLDRQRAQSNVMRGMRDQKPFDKVHKYVPIELQRQIVWSEAWADLQAELGGKNTARKLFDSPDPPDFIKPDKAYVGHDIPRLAGKPEFAVELNINKLLEHYTVATARDIFNTSIIQNNKPYIKYFRERAGKGPFDETGKKNLEHTASALEDWTAEAFGGAKAPIDRALKLSANTRSMMQSFRKGLLRSVFPLNWSWNVLIQTTSSGLTVAKYGARNSTQGMVNWLSSAKTRRWALDQASAQIKSRGYGSITQQDIGSTSAIKLERGRLRGAVDAMNYLTEQIERNLTGFSIETGRLDGIKKGLRGDALKMHSSDAGFSTQTGYNLEALPGVLRNEVVKTMAPFQTFSFEVFNFMMETAGKTGTPPATAGARAKVVLRFLGGITAANFTVNAITGRKPWETATFVPFYGSLFRPVVEAIAGGDPGAAATRGLPAPLGMGVKAVKTGVVASALRGAAKGGKASVLLPGAGVGAMFYYAVADYMKTGKIAKLRKFGVQYLSGQVGIPGGIQASRIVEGIVAISEGGKKDSAGRMIFPITTTKDKMRALLAGEWSTTEGQAYWKKRKKTIFKYPAKVSEIPALEHLLESLPVVHEYIGPEKKPKKHKPDWRKR